MWDRSFHTHPARERSATSTRCEVDRARSFYEKVFAWKAQAWGPPGFYQLEGPGVFAALQGRRDLDCPGGHAKAGSVCNEHGVGVDVCYPRITAARRANRTARLRRASPQG